MIIGFAGRARHGKDWTARHAQSLLREKAVTRGFAQALKDRVRRALDGMPGLDEAIREKPPWMRGILQAFGNGVRQADENFWVETLFEWWEQKNWGSHATLPRKEVLLVPDVRYPNEVAAIKARGGKVIKVVRYIVSPLDGVSEAIFCDPNTDPNHPSEALLDTIPDSEFDAIIYARSGETEWLEVRVEELLMYWGLVARNDGGMGDDL